jgi:hypothetical protein
VPPLAHQRHYVFETVEVVRWPEWIVHAGVGEGLTSASTRWIVTSIVGHVFERDGRSERVADGAAWVKKLRVGYIILLMKRGDSREKATYCAPVDADSCVARSTRSSLNVEALRPAFALRTDARVRVGPLLDGHGELARA